MSDIKILVVDDQHLVRTGLTHMLADIAEFTVAGEADSGEQALQQTQALQPDVVLMDVRMPGMGGIEATKKLSRRFPDVKVIAVTGCVETPFPQRLLEGGAAGFITKDAGIEEVALAVRTVYGGKRYISQEVAQEMALNVVDGDNTLSPFDKLSERELQISLMVVDGVKTADIAEQLHVSPKTINTYRYRLFEKLKIKSNMELAILASRHGVVDSVETV